MRMAGRPGPVFGQRRLATIHRRLGISSAEHTECTRATRQFWTCRGILRLNFSGAATARSFGQGKNGRRATEVAGNRSRQFRTLYLSWNPFPRWKRGVLLGWDAYDGPRHSYKASNMRDHLAAPRF